MPLFGFSTSLRSSRSAILLLSILLHSLLLLWRPHVAVPLPGPVLVPVSVTLSPPVKSQALLPPVTRMQQQSPPALSANNPPPAVRTHVRKQDSEAGLVIDSAEALQGAEQSFAQKALKDAVAADRQDRQKALKSGALPASAVEYQSPFGQALAKSALRDCRDVLAEEAPPESRKIAKISDGVPMIVVDMELLKRIKNCRW
ncbi:hypothetical protein WAE56_04280 [Iodobacter sp. LRB]|uniref:hypothetical protein n=1 Tax=unclassified Iodobacter TaxID=235634 RepID=UPI000C105D78|nr:hypothetical protein [Iodobacter sp. BJB302]PHV02871.1 hypothetical protein CSQ88_04515 [Iodobacter sp. BJB302]